MPAPSNWNVCVIFLSLVLMSSAAGIAKTLEIVGAAIIDVSELGSSDADLVDAVVVIDDKAVIAVGSSRRWWWVAASLRGPSPPIESPLETDHV